MMSAHGIMSYSHIPTCPHTISISPRSRTNISSFTVFSWEPALWLLNSQDRVMWWLSKKSIANFGYKHRLLSLDMKTKLVQHVESDWMRESESEIARESESENVWGWVLSIEMKTKVVQHAKSDWMRDWMSVRVRKSERFQVFKTFLVPSFCLTFRHF